MEHLRHSAISYFLFVERLDAPTVAKLSDTSLAMIHKHYFRNVEELPDGPNFESSTRTDVIDFAERVRPHVGQT